MREGLGPGLAQKIRVRNCLELLRRMGRLGGPVVEYDDQRVFGAKMRAREMAMRPFWEGGEGRLLGDADMPDGAEGVPEELMKMIRAAKGKWTRPGEPGQRRGMGTGMLMWKVPEAGEWQWDVLEVRAVVAQEVA